MQQVEGDDQEYDDPERAHQRKRQNADHAGQAETHQHAAHGRGGEQHQHHGTRETGEHQVDGEIHDGVRRVHASLSNCHARIVMIAQIPGIDHPCLAHRLR
ncbi:MAG: hypothetical protein HN420_18365 [Rhodospirillaceae bacterium]|nr:hypothetical protein [Rhodospirillaceae bacterium]